MYQISSVEWFLVDRKVEPEVIRVIQARMKAIAEENGTFSASELEHVIDNRELADAYRQAVAENPSLLVRQEYKHWRSEDPRHLSGEVVL